MEINAQVLNSFTGTGLALLTAAFLWIIRSAYEKHRSERLALVKFERMIVLNIRYLDDNLEHINKWIESTKNDRPYSYSFQALSTNDEDTFKLSHLGLVRQLVELNYMLCRTTTDLENTYRQCWDVVRNLDAKPDHPTRGTSFSEHNKTLVLTLEDMKKNYPFLKEKMIDALASVQTHARVRFHSMFGYLSLLFIDVVPRTTTQAVERTKANLATEMSNKNL